MKPLLAALLILSFARPLAPAAAKPAPISRVILRREASRGAERTVGEWIYTASWYGPGFQGRTMADGSPYDERAMTCASRTLPMGTRLLVERGGRSVEVLVTDRGPFVEGRDLDLSREAAREIGLEGPGVGRVRVGILR